MTVTKQTLELLSPKHFLTKLKEGTGTFKHTLLTPHSYQTKHTTTTSTSKEKKERKEKESCPMSLSKSRIGTKKKLLKPFCRSQTLPVPG